jgi:HAD superfamily hydrolase (TIGR01509 family)
LDALVFDFDGVIVDSEPIHLECFAKVLLPAGVRLTTEDYYGKYLGFDDHDCFAAALRNNGLPAGEEQIARMVRDKTRLVQETYARNVKALPGSADLIRQAAGAGVPLAICSGALREEIEMAARAIGVRDLFSVLVAARDVRRGKPDPEGYRLALEQLRVATGRPIRAEASLVVEDSAAGIEAARGAGMKVLAVTNSYPPHILKDANRIVASLTDVSLGDLQKIVT